MTRTVFVAMASLLGILAAVSAGSTRWREFSSPAQRRGEVLEQPGTRALGCSASVAKDGGRLPGAIGNDAPEKPAGSKALEDAVVGLGRCSG